MTGYFGKVSTRGDFVMRHLPASFVEAWDAWLQRCMQASRDQLGDGWLAHYLNSPVWRFAIASGVLDRQAWAGVMMPSVDRVGRYFPLMLAAPALGSDDVLNQAPWFDQLDALARDSLAVDFVLARFDNLPAPPPFGFTEAGQTRWWLDDAPCMLGCRGMPSCATFAAMLDGSWVG